MKLMFAEISQESTFYTLTDGGWFPDDEVAHRPPALAEFEVRKKTATAAILKGMIQFTAHLSCDRCGTDVKHPLKEKFEYTLTLEEERNSELSELECSDDDCITLHLKEHFVDIDHLLREQVFLAIPQKVLCSEDCRGLCPHCGALLKKESCGCSTAGSNSPFAVLEKLRKV